MAAAAAVQAALQGVPLSADVCRASCREAVCGQCSCFALACMRHRAADVKRLHQVRRITAEGDGGAPGVCTQDKLDHAAGKG